MTNTDKKTRQRGMITVEAVGSLIPFILVVMFIISLINFFMIHNKVQYALHQMGSELTSYTYLYEALNLRSADQRFHKDIKQNTEELKQTLSDLSDLKVKMGELQNDPNVTTVQNTINSGKTAASSLNYFVQDPKSILREGAFYFAEKGEQALKEMLTGATAKAFFQVYLDSSLEGQSISADAFLRGYGVQNGIDGLNFDGSTCFEDSEERLIDITVTYRLELFFLRIFFENPSIPITQRVVVPAWLDGDGTAYTKE